MQQSTKLLPFVHGAMFWSEYCDAYSSAVVPLVAQLSLIEHVGTDGVCLAALHGLLLFLLAPDTYNLPPLTLYLPLLRLVSDFALSAASGGRDLLLSVPPELGGTILPAGFALGGPPSPLLP
jgi:hypothetical protein